MLHGMYDSLWFARLDVDSFTDSFETWNDRDTRYKYSRRIVLSTLLLTFDFCKINSIGAYMWKEMLIERRVFVYRSRIVVRHAQARRRPISNGSWFPRPRRGKKRVEPEDRAKRLAATFLVLWEVVSDTPQIRTDAYVSD